MATTLARAPVLIRVGCPRCDATLESGVLESGFCTTCHGRFEMVLFDPPKRTWRAHSLPSPSAEGSAVCGNHPSNSARHTCNRCGMFVCQLCVIETDSVTLCPGCYDRLTEEGALVSTRTRFPDSSGMAATYAVAGILMWFLCLVFGPLAIIHGVRAISQRKANPEIGSTWRALLAIILGTAEIAGGIAIIVFLIRAFG